MFQSQPKAPLVAATIQRTPMAEKPNAPVDGSRASGGDCVVWWEMLMLVFDVVLYGSGMMEIVASTVEMAEMEVAACWCWWVGGDVGWRSSHDGGDDVNVVTRVRR
ncbi:hypothetical protein Tco_1369283 [Tanacetum coccineum]